MTLFKEFIDEIRKDFVAVTGIVAATAQVTALKKLFGNEMETTLVYLISIASFIVMLYFCIRYFKRRRIYRFHTQKRRLYTILCLIYVTLGLLSLLPAGYRWMYIHTPWIPDQKEPRDIEIGKLFFETVVEAHGATQQRPLEVNMYLDATRTSLQCLKSKASGISSEEAFNVDRCARFAISPARMQRLLYGHGIDEDSLGVYAFQREHSASVMQPSFDALQTIAKYRGRHEPLLDRGPVILFLFTKDASWKKKLLSEGLLPNAAEWNRLTKEYPRQAAGLRKLLVDWIGLLDPFFHVTFTNTTNKQLEVSTITYRATPRRGDGLKAELFGAYETPRYLAELQEGAHEIEIHPPIQIAPSRGTEIDLLLRLTNPDPGIIYDIEIDFVTRSPVYRSALTPFAITFYDARRFR